MSQLQVHVNNMKFMQECNKKLTELHPELYNQDSVVLDGISVVAEIPFILPQEKVRAVPNGNDLIIYYIAHYPDLPKCWIDGYQYKFNSMIAHQEVRKDVFKDKQ